MDKEPKQKYFEFKCKLDNEFTKFITTVDDPERVVCCKCSYNMRKKNGITRAQIKKESRRIGNKESRKSFYHHLLSLQTN